MDIYIYMYVYVCFYLFISYGFIHNLFPEMLSEQHSFSSTHTELFGFWCFCIFQSMMWTTKSSWSHSSRQVLPVVWIFYLLILHSFEKKSYITKFPDISPEIRKIKPTKIKHMKNTGKQFLVSSVYLIVSMLSYILSMFSLISSLFSACSHHSHFILCLHIISSHEAAASSASTPHKHCFFGRDWKESCVHMSKLFETNPSFQWMK